MMNESGPSGSGNPNTKMKKENNASDQPAIAVNQTADILKLNIDCFEESFDYLLFKDLVSAGKTCKRLQQVAGYFFQQNYSGRAVRSSEKGIRAFVSFMGGLYIYHHVKHFTPYIQKIGIDDVHGFQYFLDAQPRLHRLKDIQIQKFKSIDMIWLKKISTGKLEVLRMFCCELNNDFHEIIEQCVKLKRLEIESCTGECNWIERKYPTLEYLKIFPMYKDQNTSNPLEEIPMFLELNPNIRKFATSLDLFCRNRDKMKTANIKLDNLAIFRYTACDVSFKSLCDLLDELHKRGFYKKLQLYLLVFYQEHMDRLASLKGVNKLFFLQCNDSLAFPALNELEELFVMNSKDVTDLEMLVNNVINLKRIHFISASIDDIMPFIRRSVEMQNIKVEFLDPGTHYDKDNNIIDLLALNREREKLPFAQKVTMYVNEQIYLATKWALKGTDFGLIRIKRAESFEWQEYYDFDIVIAYLDKLGR